jgi:hypothetical protein
MILNLIVVQGDAADSVWLFRRSRTPLARGNGLPPIEFGPGINELWDALRGCSASSHFFSLAMSNR